MPELAEVEYYRKQWDPALGGKILSVSLHPDARVFRDPEDAANIPTALKGHRYEASHAHGKNLLFQFEGGHWIGGHLGMTGKLRFEAPSYEPGKHDHLTLFTRAGTMVFTDPRKFGKIRYDKTEDGFPDWWRKLPPEVLSPEFSAERLEDYLRRHAKSPIKALLLDQSRFPGIGNWMADEILWRAQIPPDTPGKELANAGSATHLRKAIRFVSRGALDTVSKDWSDPPASWLFKHRWKDGGACPKCGSGLKREDLRGRTTCWCPKCQE